MIGTVTDGIEFHILIDEGPDNSLIVFNDVPDLATARNLTNRLNNAVYRWLQKGEEKNVVTPFLNWLGR